jgi:hypothetical protein
MLSIQELLAPAKTLRPPEFLAPKLNPAGTTWPRAEPPASDHWDEEFGEDDEFEREE